MCNDSIFVSYKDDDQTIVESSPKNNIEINAVSEADYAEPLIPEEIRWFYKDGVDKRWNEFCGYDSLRIERIYQERQNLISESNDETNDLPPAEKIVVRGGMYDIEIDNMKCVSIYWPGEYITYFIFLLIVFYFLHHYCIFTNYFCLLPKSIHVAQSLCKWAQVLANFVGIAGLRENNSANNNESTIDTNIHECLNNDSFTMPL